MSAQNRLVGIVDDDPGVRRALARLVRSHGLAVRTFDSAEAFEAEGRLEAACVLIVDVDLPGASGLDLVAGLDLSTRWVPVVMLTGRGGDDASWQAAARRVGAIGLLRKPIEASDLLAVIAPYCPVEIS